MTTPLSGAISLSQVNTELGRSSSASLSMSDSDLRILAKDTSGDISMNALYGRQKTLSTTITLDHNTYYDPYFGTYSTLGYDENTSWESSVTLVAGSSTPFYTSIPIAGSLTDSNAYILETDAIVRAIYFNSAPISPDYYDVVITTADTYYSSVIMNLYDSSNFLLAELYSSPLYALNTSTRAGWLFRSDYETTYYSAFRGHGDGDSVGLKLEIVGTV